VRSRAEQIALVFNLLPSGILATLGVSTLLAWGLVGHMPRIWLYTWLGSVLLVSTARLLNLRAWRRSVSPTDHRWVQHFYLGTAIAGLTWGLAGFLLFPADSRGKC